MRFRIHFANGPDARTDAWTGFRNGILYTAAVCAFWPGGHASPIAETGVSLGILAALRIAKNMRLNRRWRIAMASYRMPALADGIDIPGWPPDDDIPGGSR
jgi:hypothetical protein